MDKATVSDMTIDQLHRAASVAAEQGKWWRETIFRDEAERRAWWADCADEIARQAKKGRAA